MEWEVREVGEKAVEVIMARFVEACIS